MSERGRLFILCWRVPLRHSKPKYDPPPTRHSHPLPCRQCLCAHSRVQPSPNVDNAFPDTSPPFLDVAGSISGCTAARPPIALRLPLDPHPRISPTACQPRPPRPQPHSLRTAAPTQPPPNHTHPTKKTTPLPPTPTLPRRGRHWASLHGHGAHCMCALQRSSYAKRGRSQHGRGKAETETKKNAQVAGRLRGRRALERAGRSSGPQNLRSRLD